MKNLASQQKYQDKLEKHATGLFNDDIPFNINTKKTTTLTYMKRLVKPRNPIKIIKDAIQARRDQLTAELFVELK